MAIAVPHFCYLITIFCDNSWWKNMCSHYTQELLCTDKDLIFKDPNLCLAKNKQPMWLAHLNIGYVLNWIYLFTFNFHFWT